MGDSRDFVIVTAANRDYFHMCLGLVLSIRRATHTAVPDVVVLDVGLDKTKIETLESLHCKVVDPGWDVAVSGTDTPSWYKAMTARAFLPRHAPGYDKYLWIDSDAWVQSWDKMDELLSAARGGAIALAEENPGTRVEYVEHGPAGARRMAVEPALIRKNVQDCYRTVFGDDALKKFGDLPILNCGVFALERSSPVWDEWRRVYADGIARVFNRMAEQQALNIIIRDERAPAVIFGAAYNYMCSHQLPAYDARVRRFVTPDVQQDLIAVMHLSDLRRTRSLRITVVPDGGSVETSLHYLDLIGSTA